MEEKRHSQRSEMTSKLMIKRLDSNEAGEEVTINITDVILVAAHVKGKKLLSGTSIKAADVNKDGKINVTDITKIAAHVKGKKLIS